MPRSRARVASAPTASLDETLAFMRLLWSLAHELQSMSKRINARLGVTGPQRLVIRILGRHPGISASELAELLALHPSTLTGVLQRLETRKLIVRSAAPSDGRRAVLRLTPAGRRFDRTSRPTVEAAVATALARVDPRAVRGTEQVLTAVIAELRER